jgi:hypothetical protein
MQQTPPRLPVPPATDRSAWDPARLDAVALRGLRDRGRQDFGSPWPALLAHAYAFGPEGPTLIHLILAGRVECDAGRARIEALDGAGTVELGWEPADRPAGVTVRGLTDPLMREVWGGRLTRLDIDVTALGPVASLTLNVKEQR